MKISDKQLSEFIALYKEEYGEDLERSDAIGQIQPLTTLVKYMIPTTEVKNKSQKDVRYK